MKPGPKPADRCRRGHLLDDDNSRLWRGYRLCRKCHALRAADWRRLNPAESKRRTAEQRFWAMVEKTDACWIWTGGTYVNGYGQFWDGSHKVPAHRYGYLLIRGNLPERPMELDHLCRNRRCVRADHLDVVTHAQNMERMIKQATGGLE